jgi:tetratricopeptide (TPR) repeat protein
MATLCDTTVTPHLVAICESETADAADSAQHGELLNRAAGYLCGRAAYSAARPLLERALAIREKALGPEHPDTATSLNNLAWLLQDQGDLAAARPLYERALAIREKALGPEHPYTKDTACVTAEALDALGRADQAAALRARYGVERDRENQ